ncbi:MAG: small subunit ribosomal protein S9 [Chloroflexi bacterium]|nr:MAG: small subunit ribosomal protein S9 [Chloroflexota bacterium]
MTTTTPQHYYYGVGRRKEAVARVRLYPGAGAVVVNGKPAEQLFTREVQRREFLEPLALTEMEGRFNAQVKCTGGGISGWAGAIRLGIARALLEADAGLRPALKSAGMLTRDSRIKERKKPGLKRARKAPQYTKR